MAHLYHLFTTTSLLTGWIAKAASTATKPLVYIDVATLQFITNVKVLALLPLLLLSSRGKVVEVAAAESLLFKWSIYDGYWWAQ